MQTSRSRFSVKVKKEEDEEEEEKCRNKRPIFNEWAYFKGENEYK